MQPLATEEYIEQAYLYRSLLERLADGVPLQELLGQLRHEILSTTRLPLAIDYLLTELRHSGLMSAAMERLGHYFHPFQAYLVSAAEAERGRFDMRLALQMLQHEAEYRARENTAAGLFMFQFECLCRNRLSYDQGLACMARDPRYERAWSEWILIVRRQVGLVDLADLIFARSSYALERLRQQGHAVSEPPLVVLFGEKEGKIAWANRQKDPLYLFSAMQRQLGYPPVPRPKKMSETGELLLLLQQKVDRLEMRLKLMEEEQRGTLDIRRLYVDAPPSLPNPTEEENPYRVPHDVKFLEDEPS
jgi:hypothetical protein